MQNTQKGFIGLLALLIATFIMAYLALKIMPKFSISSRTSPIQRTESGQFEVINQANHAKELLEHNWNKAINN